MNELTIRTSWRSRPAPGASRQPVTRTPGGRPMLGPGGRITARPRRWRRSCSTDERTAGLTAGVTLAGRLPRRSFPSRARGSSAGRRRFERRSGWWLAPITTAGDLGNPVELQDMCVFSGRRRPLGGPAETAVRCRYCGVPIEISPARGRSWTPRFSRNPIVAIQWHAPRRPESDGTRKNRRRHPQNGAFTTCAARSRRTLAMRASHGRSRVVENSRAPA